LRYCLWFDNHTPKAWTNFPIVIMRQRGSSSYFLDRNHIL